MTLTEIKDMIANICDKQGVDLIVPVELNGRLTKTLGRVVFLKDYKGKCTPVKIEFSKRLVETGSEKDLKEVILHETAHYIVTMVTKEDHGHDKVFKAMCAEIGTSNDTPHTTLEKPMVKKYEVKCQDCGRVVAAYDRKGKVLQSIMKGEKYYQCKNCKTSNLIVWENK